MFCNRIINGRTRYNERLVQILGLGSTTLVAAIYLNNKDKLVALNEEESVNNVTANKSNEDNTFSENVHISYHKKDYNVKVSEAYQNYGKKNDGYYMGKGEKYEFIILGFGIAGQSALQSLLKIKPNAKVLVVEKNSSTNIPNVKNVCNQKRWYNSLPSFRSRGSNVKYLWGNEPKEINPSQRILRLSDDSIVYFDKCLLSYGTSVPDIEKKFIQDDADSKIEFSLSQHSREELKKRVIEGYHVTVLGSGWNAVELASFLSNEASKAGIKEDSVCLISSDAGPLNRILPRNISSMIKKRLEAKKIAVYANKTVNYIAKGDDWTDLNTNTNTNTNSNTNTTINTEQQEKEQQEIIQNNSVLLYLSEKFDSVKTSRIATDYVAFASTSCQKSSDVLNIQGEGIITDVQNGKISVNKELMAASNIYVAGDAALFLNSTLGMTSFQSIDHAYHSGLIAGNNMAGKSYYYDHLPYFFGSMSSLGIRMVACGDCNSSYETQQFWWKNPNSRQKFTGKKKKLNRENSSKNGFSPVNGTGVIFYFDKNILKGILLWGVPPPIETVKSLDRMDHNNNNTDNNSNNSNNNTNTDTNTDNDNDNIANRVNLIDPVLHNIIEKSREFLLNSTSTKRRTEPRIFHKGDLDQRYEDHETLKKLAQEFISSSIPEINDSNNKQLLHFNTTQKSSNNTTSSSSSLSSKFVDQSSDVIFGASSKLRSIHDMREEAYEMATRGLISAPRDDDPYIDHGQGQQKQ